MRSKMMRMAVAILMIGGIFSLTACSDDDKLSIETINGQLNGVWYAEYEATGVVKENSVKDTDDDDEYTYDRVIDSYRFNAASGTGMWTRYYMGTEYPEPSLPIALDGGVINGEFHYTVENDGKVRIHFDNDDEDVVFEDRVVYFKNETLTANGVNNESQTFEQADKTMITTLDEWNYREHGGASTLSVSNRIYGVGYGYNFILEHSKAVSGAPIIDESLIEKRKLMATNGVDGDIHVVTYTGHSLMEVSNNFSSKAEVSGGAFGFKGEVKAAFSMESNQSTMNEYALTVVDVKLTTVELGAELAELKECRNKFFKDAVEGKKTCYVGRKGLFNLVNSFGTHLILSAKLGGRLRYANVLDLSQVSGAYELSAFARASYSKFSFKVEGSVEDKFKKSYEQNKKHMNTYITAIGGTPQTVMDLASAQTDVAFKAWKETLGQDNYQNTGVVEIVKTVPIWLLLDDEKRAKEIQDYIMGGDYERDMARNYDFREGVMGQIKSVKNLFTEEDKKNGTLIKKLDINGDVVAMACQEFIPQLNSQNRSIVLYPVVNNKPKLNLGYFIGNDSKYPQRVCWDSAHTEPTFIPITCNKTLGAQDELYLLGCSFLHKDNDAETIKSGQVREMTWKGAYMTARGLNSKGELEEEHNYPLVKIFNNIWTREDLSMEIAGVTKKNSDNQVFYNYKFMAEEDNRKKIPTGWTFASDSIFHSIKKELENRYIQRPAKELSEGGVIGFNARMSGWMYDDEVRDKDVNTYFWACEKKNDQKNYGNMVYTTHHYLILHKETGNIDVEMNPNTGLRRYHFVRLIQKIQWK